MRKSYGFVLSMILVLAFAAMGFASTQNVATSSERISLTQAPQNVVELNDEVLFTDDFEDGDLSDWTLTDASLVPQTNHWALSDYSTMSGSGNAWRCFEADLGDNGGYSDDWKQAAVTPAMNWSTGVTNPTMTFAMHLSVEGDNFDGGFVVVYYGPDADNLTIAMAPVSGDAAYNATAGIGGAMGAQGWTGEIAWATGTADLSTFIGNAHVQVGFFHGADGGTSTADGEPTLTGMFFDDVIVTSDEGELFNNNGDDNVTDTFVFLSGPDATLPDVLPNLFQIIEVPTASPAAPSGTHALAYPDPDGDQVGFEHYAESPAFDLPEIGPGENLWFNNYNLFDLDVQEQNNQNGFYIMWQQQVWVPEEYTGSAVAAGAWTSMYELNGEQGFIVVREDETAWQNFDEIWGAHSLNELAGLSGVKFRFMLLCFSDIPYYSQNQPIMWDDPIVYKTTLSHDIETVLNLPYPTTVNFPIAGSVTYINHGPNAESFNGLWGLGNPIWPLLNGPAYDLEAGPGTSVSDQFNNPTDTDPAHAGAWWPAESDEGMEIAVQAVHALATDEVADNNLANATIVVAPEGKYELAWDGRATLNDLYFPNVYPVNSGPITHFDPAEFNEEYFGADGFTFGISLLTHTWIYMPDRGYDTGNFEFVILEGGDTPGNIIWSSGALTAGVPTGAVVKSGLDVSDVTELQTLTSDFYVWIKLLTDNGEGDGFVAPTFCAKEAFSDYHGIYDGTTLAPSGGRVYLTSVTLNADVDTHVEDGVEVAVPMEFALNNAYPNPFNPSTTISFDVARNAHVSLSVYNVMGQEVARLVDREMTAGKYNTSWNASTLSSGVYFVRMEAQNFNSVKKVMLMK